MKIEDILNNYNCESIYMWDDDYDDNTTYYIQTYGGGPEGGYFIHRNGKDDYTLYSCERNWNTPFTRTLIENNEDYVFVSVLYKNVAKNEEEYIAMLGKDFIKENGDYFETDDYELYIETFSMKFFQTWCRGKNSKIILPTFLLS